MLVCVCTLVFACVTMAALQSDYQKGIYSNENRLSCLKIDFCLNKFVNIIATVVPA